MVRLTSKGSGFTLIELLVVIAIIALLASILMPTLQKAREFANRSACMSQFRAHGSGYAMYAQDYNDYVLTTIDRVNWPGYTSGNVTRIMLYKYIFPGAQGPATTDGWWCRREQIFLCPTAVKLKDTGGSPYDLPWDSMLLGRLFSTMSAMNGPPPDGRDSAGNLTVYTRRFGDFRCPLNQVLGEADTQDATPIYTLWPTWKLGILSPTKYRHLGQKFANLLLADGHVDSIGDVQGTTADNTRYFVNLWP